MHGFGGAGGWAVLSGVVSAIAGIVVLSSPVPNVVALSWLLGVVLVIIGAVGIISALGSP